MRIELWERIPKEEESFVMIFSYDSPVVPRVGEHIEFLDRKVEVDKKDGPAVKKVVVKEVIHAPDSLLVRLLGSTGLSEGTFSAQELEEYEATGPVVELWVEDSP